MKPPKATKSPPKPKSSKAKKSPATTGAAKPGRDIKRIIADLDLPTLHEDEIAELMHHAASSLKSRTALKPAVLSKIEPNSLCYTKSGDSSTVSLWSNGFKQGTTSEQDALARGIRPCGG
ncbi:hypothetical protein [Mesorhizobium sp. B2-6-2]|uniref:hypothetical protein n=1 Tax=Mesorhizobium sp. B2-6-2 TaxID=2589915 RepID=UPI001128657E|nr:hypothetical protein [Mesorhizobium sp. B2-6-2]TPJ72818.1 hypothetical protein FJ419_27265 [Mesorhizobium sp. B2-6-2]